MAIYYFADFSYMESNATSSTPRLNERLSQGAVANLDECIAAAISLVISIRGECDIEFPGNLHLNY